MIKCVAVFVDLLFLAELAGPRLGVGPVDGAKQEGGRESRDEELGVLHVQWVRRAGARFGESAVVNGGRLALRRAQVDDHSANMLPEMASLCPYVQRGAQLRQGA